MAGRDLAWTRLSRYIGLAFMLLITVVQFKQSLY
jgi:hypothetical protein